VALEDGGSEDVKCGRCAEEEEEEDAVVKDYPHVDLIMDLVS
jgi:hypothetical protein